MIGIIQRLKKKQKTNLLIELKVIYAAIHSWGDQAANLKKPKDLGPSLKRKLDRLKKNNAHFTTLMQGVEKIQKIDPETLYEDAKNKFVLKKYDEAIDLFKQFQATGQKRTKGADNSQNYLALCWDEIEKLKQQDERLLSAVPNRKNPYKK